MAKIFLILYFPFLLASQIAVAGIAPIPEEQRCKVLGDNANDGPMAMDMFSGWVAENLVAVESGGGDWLERDVNEWNKPTCVLDDGRPRLAALIPGYQMAFHSEKDWSKSLYRVNLLKEKYPNTAFSALAEVEYWIAYAWNVRGSGYASSVTPDAWRLFRERMEKAEQILINTKPYSAELPNWYGQMIIVQSALDRPLSERENVFLEGAKRYKTFLPIYFTMLNFMLPKWGGSWEVVDDFIKRSVEYTKKTEGNSMYARLYWAVFSGSGHSANFYRETPASWPKMKKGFEDLMVRYPKSSWNLNNFAKFACLAKDKKTFLLLRRQIDDRIIQAAWPQNISVDVCDHRFGYAK